MAGYVKLFGSILDSTIWKASPPTKVVWVTMMAMADRDGVVEASVPGLADRANVPRKQCEKALTLFLSPDVDSRTELYDGRRIEKVDGGWRLLNYEKYRELQSAEDRKAKAAERVRRHREREKTKKTDAVTPPVTFCNASNAIRSDETRREAEQSEAPMRWKAHDWLRQYGRAWAEAKGRLTYGRGDGDAKAAGNLGDLLASLPDPDQIACELAAPRMFATFLAEGGQAAEAEHPFSWFVGRFNALRVKAAGGNFPRSEYPEIR